MSSRRLISSLVLALFSVSIGHAQTSLPPDLPIEDWLRRPVRQDFPWKVHIREPWLTFQQRHAVQVHADFRLKELRRHSISPDDLYVVLKIADSDGRWFPGKVMGHLTITPELGNDIEMVTTLYARPGTYKVALIAYDERSRRGNVWKGDLAVPGVKADPLPDADSSLPAIQFLPQGTTTRSSRLGVHRVVFNGSAFGGGNLTLPIANDRPVQLDILANLSLSDATNTYTHQAPDWIYKINADTLLQISNVLSQVNLRNGCIRFSAIDILRQETFAYREDPANLDWDKVLEKVEELQRVKIEAHVLATQKQTADLFAKLIERMLNESTCAYREPPLRVLVVVGDAFMFPNGTELPALHAKQGGLSYYFKLMPLGAGNWDQVGSVLKPLHPTQFEFSNSLRFRFALASLLSRIRDASHENASGSTVELLRTEP